MSKERFYVNVFGRVADGWGEWLNWSQKIAETLGHPFTFGTCSVEGREGGKATRFSYSRLDRRIRQESVTAISLEYVPAEFKQLVFDWEIMCLRETQSMRVFVGCDVDFCSWDQFVEMAMGLLDHVETSYGFGERLHKAIEPGFDSVGIGTSWRPNDTENRAAQERWGRAVRQKREFEQGMFRSVYPLNILSAMHLDQAVDGSRLADAIQSQHLPGVLSVATPRAWIWQLQDSDIGPTRDVLARNKLLI